MYIVVSWAEKRDRWEWTKELPLVLLQLHLISLFLLWLRILHQSSIPLFDNITQNGLARVGEVNKFSHKFVGKFDRGYSFYGVFEGCSFFCVFFILYFFPKTVCEIHPQIGHLSVKLIPWGGQLSCISFFSHSLTCPWAFSPHQIAKGGNFNPRAEKLKGRGMLWDSKIILLLVPRVNVSRYVSYFVVLWRNKRVFSPHLVSFLTWWQKLTVHSHQVEDQSSQIEETLHGYYVRMSM